MTEFRKVRAGWYALALVTWEEAWATRNESDTAQRKHEEYVDVSRVEQGAGQWMVSIRGGREGAKTSHVLNQRSLFATRLGSFSDAKRYALALRDYLQGKGEHPDHLIPVFSAEARTRHEKRIEGIVGKPYAEWEAEQCG